MRHVKSQFSRSRCLTLHDPFSHLEAIKSFYLAERIANEHKVGRAKRKLTGSIPKGSSPFSGRNRTQNSNLEVWL